MKQEMAVAVLAFFVTPTYALDLSGATGPRTSTSSDSIVWTGGDVTLQEVEIRGGRSNGETQMRSALNTISVSSQFVSDNMAGSLMQSLAKIPGVAAMSIGATAAKPIIRGLGGNRVMVAENGLKHEAQQWDDDHGLEVDQFAVDKVVVVKGPDALSYGSDAIGGVICLQSGEIPSDGLSGGARLFFRSNNESIGVVGRAAWRKNGLWARVDATLVDYADYHVPTDSIEYYSYYIRLKDRRLRNTAGREANADLSWGVSQDGWDTWCRFSFVGSRGGFFANAHGLEVRLSSIDYDHSNRDVDLPRHTSAHLTLTNHTEVKLRKGLIRNDFGWQRNLQGEESEPISHGYMPTPPNCLERKFVKNTFQDNASVRIALGRHSLRIGASFESQVNRRSGWGFIVPDFWQFAAGGFCSDRWVISDDLIVSLGARFDFAKIRISEYDDWFKTPTADGDSVFKRRSNGVRRSFESFTWSAGVNRSVGNWTLKVNIGKGFRVPIAKELGADGVNYGVFRYEKGNDALRQEDSYQIDLGAFAEWNAALLSVTPFLNYFPNYIYLAPTSQYQEGLQLYKYTQSRVIRCGIEVCVTWHIISRLDLNVDGDYLYAEQMSGPMKGYTLPFSTPWTLRTGLRYRFNSESRFASLALNCVGAQNEIVPPEKPTSGHRTVDAAFGWSLKMGKNALLLTARVDNILNAKYYDHTSFYRLIGVPEPGRNGSLILSYNF